MSTESMSDAKAYTLLTAAVVGTVVFIAWLIMFIAGWQSVPVDKIGLHYTGGPIQGQKFVEIIEPGSGATFLGLRDKLVELPVTQRDYIVSLHSNEGDREEADSIQAPAKGGVEMQFEVSAYFTLNTEPTTVRRFYERVCIKFGCTSDGGWDRMLNNNFRKPIEQAIQQSVRRYTVNELYAGEAGESATGEEAESLLVKIQDEIAGDLKQNINKILGGQYFCGPTFDRNEPDVCPDFQFQIISATPTNEAVRNAFADNSASRQKVLTAQNNADAKVAEAEGQRRAQEALQGLYTDPAYIAYIRALAMQECAKKAGCVMIVGGDGTGTNVNVNGG